MNELYIQITEKYIKTVLAKHVSSITYRMFTNIEKGISSLPNEQFYQVRKEVSDVVSICSSDKEIQDKLKEKYPQYICENKSE